MRSSVAKTALRLMAAVLIFALAAFAQGGNNGVLSGTVVDQSGAVVSGATVTATNQATSAKFETTTNGEGIYVLPVLPVGTYNVKIAKTGFAARERKDVKISVGSKLTMDASLSVSATSETVAVSAEAPLVETERSSQASTVGDRYIQNLPVNGRNFLDFALLTPGVTKDNTRSGDLSFGGLRGTQNSLTVDGVDDNNTFFGQTTGRTGSGRAPYQFSEDSVQEFQVNTNGYSAEFGHAGGAIINAVTKSGTNKFHGTGYEFYRDRGMNTWNPITKQNGILNKNLATAVKDPYHFNQFGGTIGGPIMKDKLFFFFNYDGQRNTQPNITSFIPPAPANAEEAAAIAYLTPRAASWTRGLNQNAYLTKVDYNINSRNQLSGRWNRQNFTGLNFENGSATQSLEHTGASKVDSDTITLQLTSTLTNSLVNVARFNWLRDNEPGEANSNNPEAFVRFAGGTFSVGRNTFSPRFTNITRQEYGDSVSIIHGRHTLKFGGDIIHDHIANFFPGNFSGSYTFNTLASFGCSLLGEAPGSSATCPVVAGNQLLQAFAGSGTTGPLTTPNLNQYSVFAQDDFKVRKNLTLNIGVRYDLERVKQPTTQSTLAAAAGIATNSIHDDTNNVAPRVGFAWTPFASNKLVVRGGYGIFYGVTPAIMYGTAHSNNGVNVATFTYTGAAMPFYPNSQCGAPVASPNCAPPAGGKAAATNVFFFQPNYQQPNVQQANLGVEYQLANDWSVNANYMYVKGERLQRIRDLNLGTPNLATIAGTDGNTYSYYSFAGVPQPLKGFSRVWEAESNANSNYNALALQVNKRLSKNYQMTAAYTWSHAIDDAPDATAVVFGTDDGKLNWIPTNVALDRASGLADQRHRLVLSGIWDLNYANHLNNIGQAILGGWSVSGIWTAQSGQPYTGFVSGDLNKDNNSRTDRVLQEGRNSFNLPAFFTLDPRVTKTVKIHESAQMQLYLEAYNVFNHFNVISANSTRFFQSTNTAAAKPCSAVNNTVGTTCLVPNAQTPAATSFFGLPTNSFFQAGRILQLGAKFTF